MRIEPSHDLASRVIRRFYVNPDNLGRKNPVHIGRVWKDIKDWQFRSRQTLLGLKVLHRKLPWALRGSLFVRIMDYAMDTPPAISLPGKKLQQNDHQVDRAMNRTNRVQTAAKEVEEDSVKFLESTYLFTKKWFGFDISREELKAQIQALRPAMTFDP